MLKIKIKKKLGKNSFGVFFYRIIVGVEVTIQDNLVIIFYYEQKCEVLVLFCSRKMMMFLGKANEII